MRPGGILGDNMAKKTKVQVTGKFRRYIDASSRALDGRYTTRIGILEGSTNLETGEPIAPYAYYNEYGTVNIPTRPAFRNTYAEHIGEWLRIIRNALKQPDPKRNEIRNAYFLVGQLGVDDLRETIRRGVPPPNSPATVKAKERRGNAEPDQTLVWTGSMFAAIAADVNRERI